MKDMNLKDERSSKENYNSFDDKKRSLLWVDVEDSCLFSLVLFCYEKVLTK